MPITPEEAAKLIIQQTPQACKELNQFTAEVFQTRGGRIGSGMGGVIEALWGFYLNRSLLNAGFKEVEIAWIYGHEYNDFACVESTQEWNPETKQGEILRIEAKSMVASADESKAHFDRLVRELETSELLAVFLWDWVPVSKTSRKVYPRVTDHFIGSARGVAALRDALHVNRGGTFVQIGRCPDGCAAKSCRHIGEPLNASGVCVFRRILDSNPILIGQESDPFWTAIRFKLDALPIQFGQRSGGLLDSFSAPSDECPD